MYLLMVRAGKVNRGFSDSEGIQQIIFMPPNMSRIHKINGSNVAINMD